jgi:hypothetical protein
MLPLHQKKKKKKDKRQGCLLLLSLLSYAWEFSVSAMRKAYADPKEVYRAKGKLKIVFTESYVTTYVKKPKESII